MKNYSELSDFEINCLVAGSLGNISVSRPKDELSGSSVSYFVQASNGLNKVGEIVVCEIEVKKDFCNNPSDAWPIIVEHGISIVKDRNRLWWADANAYWVDGVEWQIDGESNQNPLRAAMIVYLMMKDNENA